MIAAIYARKSTEQNGAPEEAKSITRQVQHAREYAIRKGWRVEDQHIYSDDGISGAEFEKRPGFIRLMNALKPKPAFQVLIMSEESRLGREQIQTAYALQQLTTSGVRVWFYLTDQERKLDTATDKIMSALSGFASEIEREKAQQRTYDTMVRKAKAGHVTGGRVFGYTNVDVGVTLDASGRPKRSHVELRINETEAAIVRRIFRLYADGHGFTSIAKTLNAEGAPCPRPWTADRPRGWVSTSVRQILLRRLYVGERVWGRTKNRAPGTHTPRRRPEQEWLVIPVPHLQIVPHSLWDEAQTRWQNIRQLYLRATNGQLHGRPTNGRESPYLLTGLTACQTCNGSLFIRSRRHGHGTRRAFHYACTTHHLRGPEKCPESMLVPMELLDHNVLSTLEQRVLHPTIIAIALDKAVRQLHDEFNECDLTTRRSALQDELMQVDAELARFTAAIACGGTLATLVAAMQDRETRRAHLHAELAALNALPSASFDTARVEEELRTYLADWPSLAGRHPAQTRQLLRKLLPRRIRVWRRDQAYHYEGEAAVGSFFSGLLPVKSLGGPNRI